MIFFRACKRQRKSDRKKTSCARLLLFFIHFKSMEYAHGRMLIVTICLGKLLEQFQSTNPTVSMTRGETNLDCEWETISVHFKLQHTIYDTLRESKRKFIRQPPSSSPPPPGDRPKCVRFRHCLCNCCRCPAHHLCTNLCHWSAVPKCFLVRRFECCQ